MSDASKPTRGTDSHRVSSDARIGVTLADFEPLLAAEALLLRHSRLGTIATVSKKRPQRSSKTNRVRAEFVRFLALGGGEGARIHSLGIQLEGAVIQNTFDLRGCEIRARLQFDSCRFADEILAIGATLQNLALSNCVLNGLCGDGVRVIGDIFLRNNCCCSREFRIPGATVGGYFYISGEFTSENDEDDAVDASKCTIQGDVTFDVEFAAEKRVNLVGSRLRGGLYCKGSFNGGHIALSASLMEISGHFYLTGSFRGAVRMLGTKIRGDLICEDGSFSNTGRKAIIAQSVSASGIIWRNVKHVEGTIDFTMARVSALVDDLKSWEMADDIILDGFEYERIAGLSSPKDAESRIVWLRKQNPVKYDAKFLPGPWEHLARILREMGHLEAAKVISIEKQRELRKKGLIGSRRRYEDWNFPWSIADRVRVTLINWLARTLHLLYGALAGYGYRPLRTLIWILAGWTFGVAVYHWGEQQAVFAPTAPLLLTGKQFEMCGRFDRELAQPWTRCHDLPAEHTQFSSFMYSADVILPLVDLRQENDWAPIVRAQDGATIWQGAIVRGVMWAQILFGWVTSLLLASAAGRLVQKD